MHYDLIQIGAAYYPEVTHSGCENYAVASRAFLSNAILVDPNKAGVEVVLNEAEHPGGWVNETAVISEKSEPEIEIYVPVRDGKETWPIASLSKKFANTRKPFKSIKVRAISAKDLLKKHQVTAVERLIVDVEGLDSFVVREFMNAFAALGIAKPRLIIWEYNALGNDRLHLARELSLSGYIHTTLDKRNRLSVLK